MGVSERLASQLKEDQATGERLVHLSADGVSVVLDCRGGTLPRVLHWGGDLGVMDRQALEALARAAVPPVFTNSVDAAVQISVVPEHASGWVGLPGVSGHRDGADWSPRFAVQTASLGGGGFPGGSVTVTAADAATALGLRLEIVLDAGGLLRIRAVLTNLHAAASYSLQGLVLALPVPTEANELLDLAGRWGRERAPQRLPFAVGARVRDNRRGRTGHDASLILAAGTAGFGFRTGEVWGVHLGWSGNHRVYVERLSTGEAVIGAGELLLPGEISLAPGEDYVSPWLFASYGEGLDALSARFHRFLRAGDAYPAHGTTGGAQHMGGGLFRP